MKRTLLFVLFLLQGILIASAQTEDRKSNFSAGFGYNPIICSNDLVDFSDDITHGYSLNLKYSYNILETIPLDAFVGIGYTNAKKSDKEEDFKTTFQLMTLEMPVGLQYRIKVSDNITLVPNAALNFRIGAMAGLLQEFTGDLKKYKDKYGFYPKTKNTDFYDDYDWKRFTTGMKFGINVAHSSGLFIGYAYTTDFSEVTKGTKIKSHVIMIGHGF